MDPVENLIALYERNQSRERDLAWYASARAEANERADALGVARRRYLGVVAATSPRVRWDTKDGRRPNLDVADNVIRWHRGERETPGAFKVSALKARAILNGADPIGVLGPKTRAFYLALAGADEVVLDVWALRAIGEPPSRARDISRDEALYVALTEPYILAAERLGIAPSALQAATWTQIRREWTA